MNEDMSVRWGETLPLTLTDDEGADTATITISQDNDLVLTKTASFVDGVADLTLTAEQMEINTGIYSYMYTVVYDDGAILKYPDVNECTECELPTIEVCEANDNPEVS